MEVERGNPSGSQTCRGQGLGNPPGLETPPKVQGPGQGWGERLGPVWRRPPFPRSQISPGLEGGGQRGWGNHSSHHSSPWQWDLVCERAPLPALAQTLFMAGVLLGAFIFGTLSDRVGRRWVLLSSLLTVGAGGTGAALAPDFIAYCVCRTLSGIGLAGFLINYIGLSLEWVPRGARAGVVTWLSYCSTAGQMVLAGLAYGVQDWRHLQLAISAPFLAFLLGAWWVPESARWLLVQGRTKEALRNLQRVARVNGRTAAGEGLSLEVLVQEGSCSSTGRSTGSWLGLFLSPALRRISCCLMCVSFSTNLAYFGLSMDLGSFGLDVFLVQLCFGAVDLGAKAACALALNRCGRRPVQALSLSVAGACLLASTPLPAEMLMVRLVLVVLGKGFLAAASVCSYLYGGELFPTVVRQTGTGLMTVVARLGGMVAPLVLVGGQYHPVLPPLVFGVTPVLAGAAACFLPEMRDVPLMDTIEQVEESGTALTPAQPEAGGCHPQGKPGIPPFLRAAAGWRAERYVRALVPSSSAAAFCK
uniref:Solute carrier family 22 member 20-like n=1 Tax=Crocodylus porosus TaxID=8502 RepID=A0A7M4E7U6_CROPO